MKLHPDIGASIAFGSHPSLPCGINDKDCRIRNTNVFGQILAGLQALSQKSNYNLFDLLPSPRLPCFPQLALELFPGYNCAMPGSLGSSQ